MKRTAILLQSFRDVNEKYKTDADLALVSHWLGTARGGSFSPAEINKFDTTTITASELIQELKQYDFSFFYFSGHAAWADNRIHIPLAKNTVVTEDDLIIPGKKQGLFFDCCRTSVPESILSPAFNFQRSALPLQAKQPDDRKAWENNINGLAEGHFVYYTTGAGQPAYSTDAGGYGTQVFFLQLLQEYTTPLTTGRFFQKLQQQPDLLQQPDWRFTGNWEEYPL